MQGSAIGGLAARRTCAIAAVTFGFAATVAAQGPMDSPIPIPVVSGAIERADLEQQARATAGEGRSIWIYRWDAPVEPIARYYIDQLGGQRDAALDTSAVHPGEPGVVSYHLTIYTFVDQCIDSAGTVGGASAAPCKHWRRAKDLSRALNNGRYGLTPGAWLQRATWQWFSRDSQGALTHWTVELLDSGMTDDWKHYTPATDLTIERERIGAHPAAAAGPQ
jgi:hypothetical protein